MNKDHFGRDLKPENILFKGKRIDSPLKIIDFGKSKILKYNQKVTELAGSLYYVAPEVLSGNAYNETCDLWSCGTLLYMMLIGHPPFFGDNHRIVAMQIKEGKVDYTSIVNACSSLDKEWNYISTEAKELVQKLLCRDPVQRLSAKDALQSAWIKKYGEKDKISADEMKLPLKKLQNFRTQMSLQKAVLNVLHFAIGADIFGVTTDESINGKKIEGAV